MPLRLQLKKVATDVIKTEESPDAPPTNLNFSNMKKQTIISLESNHESDFLILQSQDSSNVDTEIKSSRQKSESKMEDKA
jgi:hypothetical protein